MSYPLAAFVAGWLAERGFDRRYLTSVVAMAAAWRSSSPAASPGSPGSPVPCTSGLDAALRTGLYPFLPADIIKIALPPRRSIAVAVSSWSC